MADTLDELIRDLEVAADEMGAAYYTDLAATARAAADLLTTLRDALETERLARVLAHNLHPNVGGDTLAIAWAHVKSQGEERPYLDAAQAIRRSAGLEGVDG